MRKNLRESLQHNND